MDFVQKFVNNEALLTVSGLALWKCLSAYWIQQNISKKYEKVGQVSDIVIFPMKSAAGNHLQTARCTALGLESQGFKDRVFMAIRKIGDTGEFMDDLIQPRLLLIKIKRVGERIYLDAPEMSTLALPADLSKTGTIINCSVNRCKNVPVVDCGDAAADWLNKFLQKQDARLVQFSPGISERRSFDVKRDFENGSNTSDKMTFAAVTPYMLANKKSLDDLNTKLEQKVTMDTFRPNIVIDGPAPFDEDNWEYLKIGSDVTMRSVEPRVICSVVNIDPVTAERKKDREPMITLDKYRKLPGYGVHASFGLRTGIDIEGDIKIGDPVYVVRK